MRLVLESQPLVDEIDYVSVAACGTLDELEDGTQDVVAGTMVSVAVRFGQVRLIDNIILE